MRKALFWLVCASFMSVAHAEPVDPKIHSQIKQFLDLVYYGDIAHSDLSTFIKQTEMEQIQSEKSCGFEGVRHTEDQDTALVLFQCETGEKTKRSVVMISFKDKKINAIEPMSYVEVPAK